MASTLSDESCEELGRWLNQQWPAADQGVNAAGAAPSNTSTLSMWQGGSLSQNASTFSNTLPHNMPFRSTTNNGSDNTRNNDLLEDPSALAPTGWASHQGPSQVHHPFGDMTNTTQSVPLQPIAWDGTFDQTPNTMSAYAGQDPTERLRSQSWQNASASELTEWQLAYWQSQQFDCESSQLPSDAWHGGDFMNNHG